MEGNGDYRPYTNQLQNDGVAQQIVGPELPPASFSSKGFGTTMVSLAGAVNSDVIPRISLMFGIDKIFWVIAIGITCVNALILRSRARKEIDRNPELADGYAQLFKGYLVFPNIPWLVMGLGIIVGGTRGVFDYFDPRSGNPYVIAFHLTGFVLWALAIFWIYVAGGAEFLVRYPGVMNYDIKSPLILKLLFAVMLLGGMAAEVAIWSGRLPVRPVG